MRLGRYLLVTFLSCPVFADTSFVMLGDTGTGDVGQYEVAKGLEGFCQTEKCDFALLLGDNFYPSGVRSLTDKQWQSKFEEPYRHLTFKFYPVLGNHDYALLAKPSVQWAYRSDRWQMPSRYYTITDKENSLDLFAIDTQKLDKDQRRWLEKKLAESKAKWKLVYGHHPIYSGGEHGGDKSTKKDLLPLFERYGVDLYASGHDHDQQVIEDDGMIFVVAGAGSKLRPTTAIKQSLFAKSVLGFSHVEVTEKHLRLRMIDKRGNVLFEKKL